MTERPTTPPPGTGRAPAEELRARIAKCVAARAFVFSLSLGMAASGILLFAARFAVPALGLRHLAVAAAATTAVAFAAVFTRQARRIPKAEACAAAVDSASQAGGALMDAERARAAGWPPFDGATVPKVELRIMPAIRNAALASAFAVAAASIPDSLFRRAAATSRENAIVEKIRDEAARLDEYAAAGILDAEKAAEVGEWIDAGLDERKTAGELLEIADHVSAALDRSATEAATAADEARNAVLAAEALAELLNDHFDEIEARRETLERISELMREVVAGVPPLSSGAVSNLAAMAKSAGTLSREELEGLLDALRECAAGCEGRVRVLTEADVMAMSQCSGGSCTNGAEALAAMLSQGSAGSDAARELDALCSGSGGGISQDPPGNSELSWNDASSEESAAFRDVQVAPRRFSGTGETSPGGLSVSDPVPNARALAVRQDALDAGGKAAAGSAPREARILPRHREAVRRYFGGDDARGQQEE